MGVDTGDFLGLSNRESYLLLFFQHYMYQSILDNNIRTEIVKGLNGCMDCAFKSDIIKSTEDFCQALSVDRASFDKSALLVDFLKALNQSKYSGLVELEDIFQERVDKNLLVEAIDKCTTDKVYLGLFGVENPEKTVKTSEISKDDNTQDVLDKHVSG